MLDTYSAGEKKIKGFESKDLFLKLKSKNKNVFYVDKGDLYNFLLYKETVKKNIIIFMGAGSISNIASNFMKIDE